MRKGLPWLFSHAAAVFPTEHAAKKALNSLGEYYGEPIRPGEVRVVLEDIRMALKDQNIEFLMPNREEIYGKWGLP